MEASLPQLKDERMGLDVLAFTFEGDIALLPAFGHNGKEKRRCTSHPV